MIYLCLHATTNLTFYQHKMIYQLYATKVQISVFTKKFNRKSKRLSWQSVSNRLEFLTGSFMYKCLNHENNNK